MKWFVWGHYGPYLSTDFDFIQKPTNGYSSTKGSYTSVNVAPKGTSGGTVHVHLVYRQKGTSPWTDTDMPLYSGTTYRYYWDPAFEGKTMQYYIKVTRALLGGEHYATRPAKYHGMNPGVYYELTVSGPALQAPVGE